MELQLIQNKIFEVRGHKIMLDFDLADLYEVETRVFNQAIKRNIESFPKDFMFRLTTNEWTTLSSQLVKPKEDPKANSSQIVMSSLKHRGARYLPYAFTEHGVTMAASILKSTKARKMNIAIVRAFIALRQLAIRSSEVLSLLLELRDRIDEHDTQLGSIYEALENLLDKKANEVAWNERERIGYKK